MNTTDDISEILAALSAPAWTAARDAAERARDVLRASGPTASEIGQIGAALLTAANNPKWEVRKAVAGAIQYLRHETFHLAVALLLKDDNAYVRDAAEWSRARRTEVIRTDILGEQHEDLLLGWLSGLEARHGRQARRDALRVAESYAELLIREARHEIVKVVSPLDLSLENIQEKLGYAHVDQAACLEHVQRARDRLRLLMAIVDSLQMLMAQVTPRFQVEKLHSLVSESVALVRDRSAGTTGVFNAEISIPPGMHAEVDHLRLVQAFSNILQNACEAYDGAEARSIRIAGRAEGERHVRLAFVDQGCGMSAEALRDAFNLYSSKKPNGTGFGLPLARKIVETEHGGSIQLASRKGAGTTVTIVLPIEQGE